MSQKYTRVPTDTFERLQLNAGVMVDTFDPTTGEIGNILGATTGGINFTTSPSFKDFGEDIDNIPNNMMELKHLEQYDPKMSGTFLTVSTEVAKRLVGGADIDAEVDIKVVPRAELLTTDYEEVWWIGDYSDVNTGADAGFLAIRLMNALNTTGFQIQSEKNEKGKFSFEFQGHYSILNQDTVPFEIYVKKGGSESDDTPSGDTYTAVDSPEGNPSEQGYYELVNGKYVLSEDTEVDSEKTYYVKGA